MHCCQRSRGHGSLSLLQRTLKAVMGRSRPFHFRLTNLNELHDLIWSEVGQCNCDGGGGKRQSNSVCVVLRIAGEGFWERNGATAFRVLTGRQCEAGERELEALPCIWKATVPSAFFFSCPWNKSGSLSH